MARPTPPQTVLRVGTAAALTGQQVAVPVTIDIAGVLVAGTQNDISFDGVHISIAARPNGKPDCAVNPDIDKAATSFAFRPAACSGTACTSVRALVLSTDNINPIPDGSVLYTCKVDVAGGAGTYPLAVSGIILSTPDGEAVPNVRGIDGTIVVADATSDERDAAEKR